MIQYKNNGSFICDKCRNVCKGGCHQKLMDIKNGDLSHYEENKDLIGRKQIIHCLGKYCSSPCDLQKENYTPFNDEDEIKPLMELINWMGNKINSLIEENNNLKKLIQS